MLVMLFFPKSFVSSNATVPNFVVLCVTSFHNKLFAYLKKCKFASLGYNVLPFLRIFSHMYIELQYYVLYLAFKSIEFTSVKIANTAAFVPIISKQIIPLSNLPPPPPPPPPPLKIKSEHYHLNKVKPIWLPGL
jgi:hypothetical protein